MKKEELEFINERMNEIHEQIICADDLRPYLKDRTLLYGYTCERETFHVYLKNMKIHTVIYQNDYSDKDIKPKNIREIEIKKNQDYIPSKRIYPETCDFRFCKLLKMKGLSLPFLGYDEKRPEKDFYGFILDDLKENNSIKKLSDINIDEYMGLMANNAWYGKKSETTFVDLEGNKVLSFYGHTYEPSYENFSSTCAVYGYDKNGKEITLFDKDDYSADSYRKEVEIIGSMEEIKDYIKKHDFLVIEQ